MSRTSLTVDLLGVETNELVRRALSGCADSFTELSRRFRPRLVRLLQTRLGGHWRDAEEVAQDALASAFQQLARFDPHYRFSTWLYTIALRLAYDHARVWRRRQPHVSLDDHDPMSPERSPADVIDQRDELNHVWSTARACLATNQFTALWLRFGEDLTVPEIAAVMRKSQVGVRVLLHRARIRLVKTWPENPSGGSTNSANSGE